MRKIYNKKGFRSGLVFLFLGFVGSILIILRFDSFDNFNLIKNIAIDIISYLIGITSLSRSLSYTDSQEDAREDDERSELVALKAQSSSFNICFIISLVLSVLMILGYAITKVEELLYLYIPIGIMSGIMFITIIITSLYYDKKC